MVVSLLFVLSLPTTFLLAAGICIIAKYNKNFSFYMWTMSLTIVCCLTLVILILCVGEMNSAVLSKDEAVVVIKNSDNVLKNMENNTKIFDNKTSLDKVYSGVENNESKDNVNSFVEESRKKQQNNQGFMQRILPMMIIPFMVSTNMIPMMLISLKFMLLKSALIGKIAVILMLINMFRGRNNGGGVFSHNINAGNDVAMQHYGWHGDEEYGAYVNRRRKREST